MPNESAFSRELDERIYPLEAVQNALYSLTDRVFARVESADAGKIKILLDFKPETSQESRARLAGELDNELLHQSLRLRVSQANQKIREFIVTKALVSAQPASATAEAAAQAAAAEPCPECAPPAPPKLDAALEKEIDQLLAQIDGAEGSSDPLGVAVPWEEKFANKPGAKKRSKPKKQ